MCKEGWCWIRLRGNSLVEGRGNYLNMLKGGRIEKKQRRGVSWVEGWVPQKGGLEPP